MLVRVKPAGASTWKTKHVYALNGGVAGQVLAERTVTAWSGTTPTAWTDAWLHYDLLGNVVGWHGPSGEFTRADRDAYGRSLPGTIAAQTPSGYGLTTKPRDPATGLIWFGTRWYDPDNGRWIEPEPTGADGPNLYWYGLNQVVNGIDYDGLSWGQIAKDVGIGAFQGACASIAGIIPFADPFEGLGVYGPDTPGIGFSKFVGGTSIGILVPGGMLRAAGIKGPWLGKIAIHPAHPGGPHQYPHIQIMVRTGKHTTKHCRIPVKR